MTASDLIVSGGSIPSLGHTQAFNA